MIRKILFCAVAAATISGCAVSVGSGTGVEKIADASQESLEKQFVPGVAKREDVALQQTRLRPAALIFGTIAMHAMQRLESCLLASQWAPRRSHRFTSMTQMGS